MVFSNTICMIRSIEHKRDNKKIQGLLKFLKARKVNKEKGELESTRKLSIEDLGADAIQLILRKLPCVDRYNLYSMLTSDVRNYVNLCLPPMLYMIYNVEGRVICEEEGFEPTTIDLAPLAMTPRNEWGYSRNWFVWTSRGGLVAALTETRKYVVVMNPTTRWVAKLDMPRFVRKKVCFLDIVLRHGDRSEDYKLMVIEESARSTFHIYSSDSKNTLPNELYLRWHALENGFLYGSIVCGVRLCLHIVNTRSEPWSRPLHSERLIYYCRLTEDDKFGIEIVRPIVFLEGRILAFARTSISPYGIDLFEWDVTNREWFVLSTLPSQHIMQLFIRIRSAWIFHLRMVAVVAFQRGNKVGLAWKSNDAVVYDLDTDYWEFIHEDGLYNYEFELALPVSPSLAIP